MEEMFKKGPKYKNGIVVSQWEKSSGHTQEIHGKNPELMVARSPPPRLNNYNFIP